MDALILSTLLFNTLGIAVIVLRTAIAACLPERRQTRLWALVDAEAEATLAELEPVAGGR